MSKKRCGKCSKRMPKNFKKAHEGFHARGDKTRGRNIRSAAAEENLRLSRGTRKQKRHQRNGSQ